MANFDTPLPSQNSNFNEDANNSNTSATSKWQLFTSHGLVLISILNNPGRTVREMALELNLTDRAVAQAISDLVNADYLVRERIGRRTYYHVNETQLLKYPVNPYGSGEPPKLIVSALRAENLATHASQSQEQLD